MKTSFPPGNPKQCPCGHKHVSWSAGEDQVYCWDCDRKYPVSECFGSRALAPTEKVEEDSAE